MKLRAPLIFLTFLGFANSGYAQDIDAIIHRDILSAAGGISFQQMAYSGNRLVASRKPYTYMLQGNVNLKILGFIDAPFTFIYSNLGNKYTQATFNQSSIHPSYKWIKLHLGTIASSWSPYTLNGHVFRGGAVDLQPGKVSFSCAAGQFVRRVEPEGAISNSLVLPSYSRNGVGAKLEYNGAGKVKISSSVFGAADNIRSLPATEFQSLTPKENLAAALQLEFSPFKKLQLHVDGGRSWLRNNKTEKGYFRKTSTEWAVYNAYKVNAIWAVAAGNLSLNYERIDPGYQTLGAYYFNNNLENITIGAAMRMLKNKLNIQGSIGKQRDNLDKKRISTLSRTAGNLSISYNPGKRLQMQANYSNFISHTNMRSFEELNFTTQPYPSWDTLNFRQISSNMSGNISYQLSANNTLSQTLSAGGFIQSGNESGGGVASTSSRLSNAMLRYTLQHKNSGLLFSASANANQNNLRGTSLWQFSPGFTMGMSFFKKKLKVSQSLVMSSGQSTQIGNLTNYRLTAAATLWGAHSLQCSYQRLQRSGPQAFFENLFTLNYSVNTTFFDTKGKK
jgi:hypothetical protein